MTSMSTVIGAGTLAHGLHYATVVLGLWGLAALLLPHALERFSLEPMTDDRALRDEHEVRIAALRTAVANGSPGIATRTLDMARRPGVERRDLAVPLLVVASTAAAGIHAAVTPPHLREQLLFGAFFLVVACAQLAWSCAVLREPRRAVLVVGIAGNTIVLALWALTRLVGLPLGLLPDPHPVGAWDVACAVWEVAVIATCARLLATSEARPCPGWFAWHPGARAAAGAAAATLVLLTLIGAHS